METTNPALTAAINPRCKSPFFDATVEDGLVAQVRELETASMAVQGPLAGDTCASLACRSTRRCEREPDRGLTAVGRW